LSVMSPLPALTVVSPAVALIAPAVWLTGAFGFVVASRSVSIPRLAASSSLEV